MNDRIFEEWLAWSRANPEPESDCCCECHREERDQRAALARLTPEMIEDATRAIFGKEP